VTLLVILGLSHTVQAADFTCSGGDVACLIAAINQANANGHKNTIELQAGAYNLTAVDNDTNGPNGLPSITSTLTIKGAGANATSITRIFGTQPPFFCLIHVAATGNLTLEGVTLSGGGFELIQGGGLVNDGGTIQVVRSAITGNAGSLAGGLVNNAGTVSFEQTTLSGNGGDSLPARSIVPMVL
jgi:hypothetical protein